jgi:carboxypeptidase Q
MIRPCALLLGLALLSQQLCAQAPTDAFRTIVEESDSNSRVMNHLDELVNGIGPRLTSSENLETACKWAMEKFKSFGIENARLEEWGTFPVGFNRGPWEGRMTAPEEMTLEFGTASWSPGTKGPQRGQLVRAPEDAEEMVAAAHTYKGTWVISPRRMRRGEDNLSRKDREDLFIELGILGEIRSTRDLIVTSGRQNVDFDNLPRLLAINVKGEHFRKLAALLDEGKEVVLEFDVQNNFKRGPIPLHNVIAEIKGTERPEELVIVGGHIDSWDGATGTTDNGTGVATTIEAARLIMKAKAAPRRTIRFMLWSGEEQGLLGSRAYIRNHPEENDRISCVLVHDGGTNYVAGMPATEKMYPVLSEALAPLKDLDPKMAFEVRQVRSLPYPIGSDHDSYLAVGVPGFFWTQRGRAVYTRTHHTQHDTYDAAIPEYQKHSAKVIALAALAIANLPEKLDRTNVTARSRRFQQRRTLGVTLVDGLNVESVVDGSPAAKAGILAGDRIVSVDGVEVSDRDQLAEALKDGSTKDVKVVRKSVADGADPLVIKVTFDR